MFTSFLFTAERAAPSSAFGPRRQLGETPSQGPRARGVMCDSPRARMFARYRARAGRRGRVGFTRAGYAKPPYRR